MSLLAITACVFALMLALLLSGVWVAVALTACGWIVLQFVGGGIPAGAVLTTTVWANSTSYSLAALPLFVLMGEILGRTEISSQTFRGLAPWLNRIPGRLMHVNVLACGLFGSVSGSSAATCAIVAKNTLPELKRRGYDEMLSIGSLAGAGTLGLLIPPSVIMVIYAVAANVSLIKMFLAGFLPSVVVMLLYSGYIAAWHLIFPARQPPAEAPMALKDKLKASLQLIPVLLLMVFVFLAMVFGWATDTEAAGVGVIGSMAIALKAGTLSWKTLWDSVMGATRVTCMIMLIVAGGSFLAAAVAYSGIPQALTEWVGSFNFSRYGLIAALMVMYVLMGILIDGVSMILLTIAVAMPLIKSAGIDLIWFGIFLVLAVEMGQIHPPVGFNLFVLQKMTGKDSNAIAIAAFPFFLLLIITVAIITVFPQIVMVLPDMLGSR